MATYGSESEDIVYDVRDFIRSNYDTYLTNINSGKSDSVAVQSIKESNIEIQDIDPHNHSDYPAMDVYPRDIAFTPISNTADVCSIDFTALIAINEGNPQSIVQKIMRYAQALRGILRDYRDLGGVEWDLDPEAAISIAIYPAHSDETGLKIATVEWRVIQDVAA